MKRLFLLLAVVLCVNFTCVAAESSSNVDTQTVVAQQSIVERFKNIINTLYKYVVEDDVYNFWQTLQEQKDFISSLTDEQMEQIGYQLEEWAKSNGYKMERISQFKEYAEDVVEGRIQR